MLLKDYYPKLNKKFIKIKFNGIAFDSSNIKYNYIFFAIKGNNLDGNKFIKDAIKKGSKIIISEKFKEGFKNSVLYLNNKNPRKLLAEFAAKINTFTSVFPTSDPKFVLAVMLDEPKVNKEFVYHYRDDRYPYKGNWRNTAGWTTVWVTGQIIDKIGPILATKY